MCASENLKKKKSLYLLTEDGFFHKFAVQLLTLSCLAALVFTIPFLREAAIEGYYHINNFMLATAHRYAWWSILGLLSSSCCALQILLNMAGLGCAGFNTVLGPWRPTALAWTVSIQIGCWKVAWNRPYQWAPTATSTVVVLTLAFLPEMMHYCFKRKPTERKSAYNDATPTKATEYQFKMTNVGCTACLVAIQQALKNSDGFIDMDSNMETSILTVKCSANMSQDYILECLEDAGFPMKPHKEQ